MAWTDEILDYISVHWELAKTAPDEMANFLAVAIPAAGVLFAVLRFCALRLRSWYLRRSLRRPVGAELCPFEEIKRATEFYVKPDCQSVDPVTLPQN